MENKVQTYNIKTADPNIGGNIGCKGESGEGGFKAVMGGSSSSSSPQAARGDVSSINVLKDAGRGPAPRQWPGK